MNCKPNSLVIVVSSPVNPHLLGRIIRLTTRAPDAFHSDAERRPCWYYEAPLMLSSRGTEILRVNDCTIRPINDPGDALEDETLSWKRLPMEVV